MSGLHPASWKVLPLAVKIEDVGKGQGMSGMKEWMAAAAAATMLVAAGSAQAGGVAIAKDGKHMKDPVLALVWAYTSVQGKLRVTNYEDQVKDADECVAFANEMLAQKTDIAGARCFNATNIQKVGVLSLSGQGAARKFRLVP